MSGDHNDLLQLAIGKLGQQLEAITVREDQIEENDLGCRAIEASARFAQRPGRPDLVRVLLEHLDGGACEIGLVVDQQYARHLQAPGSVAGISGQQLEQLAPRLESGVGKL
jgi:hypothetical protein